MGESITEGTLTQWHKSKFKRYYTMIIYISILLKQNIYQQRYLILFIDIGQLVIKIATRIPGFHLNLPLSLFTNIFIDYIEQTYL